MALLQRTFSTLIFMSGHTYILNLESNHMHLRFTLNNTRHDAHQGNMINKAYMRSSCWPAALHVSGTCLLCRRMQSKPRPVCTQPSGIRFNHRDTFQHANPQSLSLICKSDPFFQPQEKNNGKRNKFLTNTIHISCTMCFRSMINWNLIGLDINTFKYLNI